jgi:hypothetical protein
VACRLSRQRKKAEQELLFGPPLPKKKPMSDAERRLWQVYGLTQADYDLMLAAQNGLCAICERKPDTKLCVDHCHATRQLRFLLCGKCNVGFGQFNEDPRVLRRALAYAEFWQRLKAAGTAVRLVPEPRPRKRRARDDRPAEAEVRCQPVPPSPVSAVGWVERSSREIQQRRCELRESVGSRISPRRHKGGDARLRGLML